MLFTISSAIRDSKPGLCMQQDKVRATQSFWFIWPFSSRHRALSISERFSFVVKESSSSLVKRLFWKSDITSMGSSNSQSERNIILRCV